MNLIHLKCCKKTIHEQCLLAYLGVNNQCLYCCCILDLAKVLEYPIIDRSVPPPPTPATKLLSSANPRHVDGGGEDSTKGSC
jgi:hypothetical protein